MSYTFCKDFIATLVKAMSSTEFGSTTVLLKAFDRVSSLHHLLLLKQNIKEFICNLSWKINVEVLYIVNSLQAIGIRESVAETLAIHRFIRVFL